VLIKTQKISAAVANLVTLGLFVPSYPDLESVQKLIRSMTANVEDLNVNRAYVAGRPIYDVPCTACPGYGWNDSRYSGCND